MAISDVDTEGLKTTEDRLAAIGAKVKGRSSRRHRTGGVPALRRRGRRALRQGEQIYNNAGIACSGDVEVSHFQDIERVMDVDYWGVVNGRKRSCRT